MDTVLVREEVAKQIASMRESDAKFMMDIKRSLDDHVASLPEFQKQMEEKVIAAVEATVKKTVNGKIDNLQITLEPLINLMKVSTIMRAFAVFVGPFVVLFSVMWAIIKYVVK
jgi:hypothetical protein